ncbi:uncharacterized protein LOC115395349 [Salarias fasciatus]|uniref:uncharacterized protein LOC115395349 n=1 Tax=Salarias fasciatus TaxID=181472 RepID=UPI0011770852|nr:uncharacterized protein LOC115395349 [Salarias fasciatus]
MSSDPPPLHLYPPPPPYRPLGPDGPSAPVFSSGLMSAPGTFPGSPYQTFPQSFSGGGDLSYYQGSGGVAGSMPPLGPMVTQPGYQVGPPGSPVAPYPSKHTVFVVHPQQEAASGGVSGMGSRLAALSTALCCCSLLPLAFQHCC